MIDFSERCKRIVEWDDGREYAEYGLEDFLEIKGIAGYEAAE